MRPWLELPMRPEALAAGVALLVLAVALLALISEHLDPDE